MTSSDRQPKIVGGIEYFWIGDEQDVQCARCGSSCYPVDCSQCGGEGFTEDEDDWDSDPNALCRCDICSGEGGWSRCCSSREWCEAHPMPGREMIASTARQTWEADED